MLNVPHRRQNTPYTCGPACLRMVLAAHGIVEPESTIAEAVNCTPEAGTSPANMAKYLRSKGFTAYGRRMLELADIKNGIKRGRLYIVCYQAWAGPGVDYPTTWSHGHYAVVTNVAPHRVTLADPSAKKPRIHIEPYEFLSRWRDLSANGTAYIRWGLAIGPKQPKGN